MSKNDDQIKKLLTAITSKKEKLDVKPRASWKTNCIFKQNGYNHTNINTINNVEACVDIVSVLLREQTFKKDAAKLLDVSALDLSWNGFSFDNWLHDLKLRASMLVWDAEKKKLNALENKLKDLRSEDAKTEDTLTDIMQELSV